MTFDELRSQLQMGQRAFETAICDTFGQSIKRDVFDLCDDDFGHLIETSEQADTEKKVIDALLIELRLIVI